MKTIIIYILETFLIAALLAASLGHASEERTSDPLLELGAAGGVGVTPDYPASDQVHVHYIAFPALFYRGTIFRADREEGARARVVERPIVAVDVSGSGSFPIDSSENRARDGMPSLDWMGEVGPRLYVRLLDARPHQLRAHLALRGAWSARLKGGRFRGLVWAPGFAYEKRQLMGQNVSFFAKLTAEWASKEFHDYFYAVPPDYATSTRPEYHARAGYLGTWLSGGFSYQWGLYGLHIGGALIRHDGAVNSESPLFKSHFNYTLFAGFSWFFYQSEARGYR
ncbi:MAG: MipA/OmpV family protein [Bdellovibrionales bacterium]